MMLEMASVINPSLMARSGRGTLNLMMASYANLRSNESLPSCVSGNFRNVCVKCFWVVKAFQEAMRERERERTISTMIWLCRVR